MTWPSTNTPRIRHVISTFHHASRSFFSDSFPTATTTSHNSNCHAINLDRTPELIPAVDVFHQHKLILSKVVETETESGWSQCSLFRVDLLDPKDSIKMVMEYPRGEEACENLGGELRLSWIVIDPRGKRAVNASSGKAATVRWHWLSGEVQVRFATVVGRRRDGSATEVGILLIELRKAGPA
ncbi:hypothetical protein SESBI_26043 [Sesbania bispinosa]|nr:hypothetical protein SESBI_26043 [Sesbania bispinosa]